MVRQMTKITNIYLISHLFFLLIYYMLFFMLKSSEVEPITSVKYMLIAFTVANGVIYFISNSINEEKRDGKRIKKKFIVYAFVAFQIIAILFTHGFLITLF